MTYQSTGGELEKQACNDGSEQLSDPIENAPKQGDVATDEGAEGDGWVDVAAGDVCADGDCHEEGEGMGDSGGDEAGRRASAAIGELSECHTGAFSGKDENQHRKELCRGGFEGVRLANLGRRSHGDSCKWHFCLESWFWLRSVVCYFVDVVGCLRIGLFI